MHRGRPPKPAHEKRLMGNPGKRPLPPEVRPDTRCPSPPAFLSSAAKMEWKRLAPMLHATGRLNADHRGPFAAYCAAWGEWADIVQLLTKLAGTDSALGARMLKTPKGCWMTNPLIQQRDASEKRMLRTATEFGITPSSACRVPLPDPGSESERILAEFTGDDHDGDRPLN